MYNAVHAAGQQEAKAVLKPSLLHWRGKKNPLAIFPAFPCHCGFKENSGLKGPTSERCKSLQKHQVVIWSELSQAGRCLSLELAEPGRTSTKQLTQAMTLRGHRKEK